MTFKIERLVDDENTIALFVGTSSKRMYEQAQGIDRNESPKSHSSFEK
jgi:hypothetical protein